MVVVAEATTVKSSDPDLEVSSSRANHEEADTRGGARYRRDSPTTTTTLTEWDIRLYMKAGTSNAPKYFPVPEIQMLLYIDLVYTVLAFHAVTGCDSILSSVVMARNNLGGIQATSH